MIASLIVGYFANGIYQFLFLFVVGVVIAVPATHPMIKPDGIGIRMTVDLVPVKQGGLKYALDNIYQIPFVHAAPYFIRRHSAAAYCPLLPEQKNRPCLQKQHVLLFRQLHSVHRASGARSMPWSQNLSL